MSCRWKLDSWFHQSCQYAMSWVPWEHVEGSQSLCEQLVNQTSNAICKQRRCTIMWIIKVLTCMPFSDFSSSFAVWSLDFRLSYWRMAAAPKEQPVNWNGVRKHPEALYCPKHQCTMHPFHHYTSAVENWGGPTPTVNISGVKSVSLGTLGGGWGTGVPASVAEVFVSCMAFFFFMSGLLASRRNPHLCWL